MNAILEFTKHLEANQHALKAPLVIDSQIHRTQVAGDKRHQTSGWYVLYQHGDLLVGVFGNWRTRQSETWCSKNLNTLTDQERKNYADSVAKAKELRLTEEAKLHAQAKAKAQKLLAIATPAAMQNKYVAQKGIRPHGIKQFSKTMTLLVPLFEAQSDSTDFEIVNLQFISPDGSKKFLTGGKKKGCFYCIGNQSSNVVVICEGFATGASIAEATSYRVVIAFDAGNLLPVARQFASNAKPDTRIIIAADNDVWGEVNTGIKKANEAANAINALVAIPNFSGLDVSNQPTDFNDLHQLADLAEVKRQIDLVLNPDPPPNLTETEGHQSPIGSKPVKPIGVNIITANNVKMEPINWLIQNWLPLGKLTLLAGQAGTGKTQLAISIAAMLSAGRHLPDGSINPPFSVLMWSGEDDISTVITPRYKASSAQMNRIHLVQSVTEPNGQYRPFDFGSDLSDLKAKAAQIGDIGLIIIDPIVSVVAGDSNKSSDVRAGLQPIVDMAQDLNCAIIGITHYRKSSNAQNVSDDVLGSQAYIAVPRVAWGTKRRDSDNTCIVAIIKNNLAPMLGGYEYTIETQTVFNDLGQAIETSKIIWGEFRSESASQLFREFGSNGADETENLSEPSKLLIDLLKDGSSHKVSDIKLQAEAQPHISWRSVERAANALKVVRQRTNTFPSETFWCLPPISPHLEKREQNCA